MPAFGVLNAEVVNNENKDDRAPLVTPEAWCDSTLVVTVLGQSCGEEVVSTFASLFEAVDAFVDFKVYPVVCDVLSKVVLIDKLLQDVSELIRTYSGRSSVVPR